MRLATWSGLGYRIDSSLENTTTAHPPTPPPAAVTENAVLARGTQHTTQGGWDWGGEGESNQRQAGADEKGAGRQTCVVGAVGPGPVQVHLKRTGPRLHRPGRACPITPWSRRSGTRGYALRHVPRVAPPPY